MQNERHHQSEVPMTAGDDGGSEPGANLNRYKAEFSETMASGRRAIERTRSRRALGFLSNVQQESAQ